MAALYKTIEGAGFTIPEQTFLESRCELFDQPIDLRERV